MTTHKSISEILDETVKHYGPDPTNLRSRNHFGVCLYQDDSGRQCAVGRCMIDPGAMGYPMRIHSITKINADLVDSGGLDSLLKEEYRGLSISFWVDVQSLHDQGINWEAVGLSKWGHEKLDDIKVYWDAFDAGWRPSGDVSG